ncbi:lanthionine synthetase LanC family protein [Gemmatimonadota bacterium]
MRSTPCRGVVTLAALLAVGARPCPTVSAQPEADRYLETASAGLEWLAANAVRDEQGLLRFPVVPAEAASSTSDPTLYHGLPGPVLAFLQAWRATGERRWRELAEQALETLRVDTRRLVETGEIDAGLYTGLAGIGSTELAAWQALGDDVWLDEAYDIGLLIVQRAIRSADGHGVHWNGVVDVISGAAGTGLFLLALYEATGEGLFLERARSAGAWLVAAASIDPASGFPFWPIQPGADMHYPNFSHGTAGVAFFLGRLAALDPLGADFGVWCRRALAWLEGHGEAGGCIIYHHDGDGEDLQYVSWCHGPAGTARVFLQEGGPAARGSVGTPPALLAGVWLLEQGPEPGESPSGYWNNVSICCGTAGLLGFMLDLHQSTGDPVWLEGARRYADVLVERAQRSATGLSWPQAEHRTRPDLVQAQTGWMQGAAGISAMLLRIHLATAGRADSVLRLPDEITP